ncbi:MAG: alpha-amylase family glycosyl hydrolase, partial [Pirellulales bacterium]
MTWQEQLRRRAAPRLESLYGPRGGEVAEQVAALAERYVTRIPGDLGPRSDQPIWSERDAVLICYGDNIHAPDEPPLATLRTFLTRDGLHELLPVVHLLPFFPYSSDDGFSVIDYRRIDPALGDWADVARLGEKLDLMFDLVLNHCSQHSAYFQGYLAGEEPYERFFIEADPRLDLSQVTRPRSLPLLTSFKTNRGEKFVWTTFSDDQVDLNYADPAVLLEMLDVFLMFLERGARIVRLDAIAYLWKEIGTTCIHLPQTHQVVKLLRDLVDAVAPRCRILTETNVPHHENVSYLGEGDEAHMIYQFSLAPLLLDACYQEDAQYLTAWLDGLQPLEAGTTYFNFTASHDGVGVRPAEGLLPEERLHALVEEVRARGGRVNTRRRPDGSDAPYELNITYFDALGWPPDDAGADESLHVRRFLTSQAIMLAL